MSKTAPVPSNTILSLPTHVGWLLSSLDCEDAHQRALDTALADLAHQLKNATTEYMRDSHKRCLHPVHPGNNPDIRPDERSDHRLATSGRMAA